MEGIGGMKAKDGKHYDKGTYKNGKFVPESTGNAPGGEDGKYVGALKDGKRNGQGTVTYPQWLHVYR